MSSWQARSYRDGVDLFTAGKAVEEAQAELEQELAQYGLSLISAQFRAGWAAAAEQAVPEWPDFRGPFGDSEGPRALAVLAAVRRWGASDLSAGLPILGGWGFKQTLVRRLGGAAPEYPHPWWEEEYVSGAQCAAMRKLGIVVPVLLSLLPTKRWGHLNPTVIVWAARQALNACQLNWWDGNLATAAECWLAAVAQSAKPTDRWQGFLAVEAAAKALIGVLGRDPGLWPGYSEDLRDKDGEFLRVDNLAELGEHYLAFFEMLGVQLLGISPERPRGRSVGRWLKNLPPDARERLVNGGDGPPPWFVEGVKAFGLRDQAADFTRRPTTLVSVVSRMRCSPSTAWQWLHAWAPRYSWQHEYRFERLLARLGQDRLIGALAGVPVKDLGTLEDRRMQEASAKVNTLAQKWAGLIAGPGGSVGVLTDSVGPDILRLLVWGGDYWRVVEFLPTLRRVKVLLNDRDRECFDEKYPGLVEDIEA